MKSKKICTFLCSHPNRLFKISCDRYFMWNINAGFYIDESQNWVPLTGMARLLVQWHRTAPLYMLSVQPRGSGKCKKKYLLLRKKSLTVNLLSIVYKSRSTWLIATKKKIHSKTNDCCYFQSSTISDYWTIACIYKWSVFLTNCRVWQGYILLFRKSFRHATQSTENPVVVSPWALPVNTGVTGWPIRCKPPMNRVRTRNSSHYFLSMHRSSLHATAQIAYLAEFYSASIHNKAWSLYFLHT